jgi:hypothetical protein
VVSDRSFTIMCRLFDHSFNFACPCRLLHITVMFELSTPDGRKSLVDIFKVRKNQRGGYDATFGDRIQSFQSVEKVYQSTSTNLLCYCRPSYFSHHMTSLMHFLLLRYYSQRRSWSVKCTRTTNSML